MGPGRRGDRLTAARPRSLQDPAAVAARRARLAEPHVAPLAAYAAALPGEVPHFDPAEAGVGARLLLLLEAPGPRAAPGRGGTGFVSADNDSATSENLWRAHAAAGTDRATEVVTWNVVPWYLGDERRVRAAAPPDLRAGAAHLHELLGLLPGLRAVVLLGRAAQRGWDLLNLDLPAVAAPHPSATNINARPWAREELHVALAVAREQAGLA